MKKVLSVASGGGHWIQLLRLSPAFEGCEVRFVTTNHDFGKNVDSPVYVVNDSNINQKFKVSFMFLQMLWILIKYRPDVVITTGAAPGFAAIFWGKLFKAKTIWIDSIANAGELSGSGKRAKRFADVWLTQWEHLESESGPRFEGRVV